MSLCLFMPDLIFGLLKHSQGLIFLNKLSLIYQNIPDPPTHLKGQFSMFCLDSTGVV